LRKGILVLRAESLSLGYPARPLIDRLSLEFRPGSLWAILGRNGSGKSTLVHVLAGLARANHGAVHLDCVPVSALPGRALARRIGVLLQEESREFWGSVREYVLLGRHPHANSLFGWGSEDLAITEAELEGMHLGAVAERQFATLSGGERQRARAAALFAQRPSVYLLDEPLQHLDLPHQVAVLERLARVSRDEGATVIIVLHDLLLAGRYCDRFLLLHGDGRYAHGAADEMLTPERLGELYGFPLELFQARGEKLFLPRRDPGTDRHV
jgi:iron complex transport system ATP-binding protein